MPTLSQIYENINTPTNESVYILSAGTTNDSVYLDAVASDEDGLNRLIEYYVKEHLMFDKIVGVSIKEHAVYVKYDEFGDGNVETMVLGLHRVPVMK